MSGVRSDRALTGVSGLDRILGGGFPRNRTYLVRGAPGTGKTTLGLQFLLHGVRDGERALYVAAAGSRDDIESVGRSHQWPLEGLHIHALNAGKQTAEMRQTVFHPADVELGEAMSSLLDVLGGTPYDRVVVDSLIELRLLAADPLRYRREIAALRRHLSNHPVTALFVDDLGARENAHIETLVDGVIALARRVTPSGATRRFLYIRGMRGLDVDAGRYDAAIAGGGVSVYPRRTRADVRRTSRTGPVSSGIAALDDLAGGGLDRASSTLLVGPSGTGKTTVAVQYAVAAAARGERAVLYLFDENPEALLRRCDGLGIPLSGHVAAGRIKVARIDADVCAPGEFAYGARETVERGEADIVAIDGLAAWPTLTADERDWMLELRHLLGDLAQQGAVTLVVALQRGPSSWEAELCRRADTVFVFRYHEHGGKTRRALSVRKRRGGNHRRSDHILELGKPRGIEIGPAVTIP